MWQSRCSKNILFGAPVALLARYLEWHPVELMADGRVLDDHEQSSDSAPMDDDTKPLLSNMSNTLAIYSLGRDRAGMEGRFNLFSPVFGGVALCEKRGAITEQDVQELAQQLWSEMDEYVHRSSSRRNGPAYTAIPTPTVTMTSSSQFRLAFSLPPGTELNVTGISRMMRRSVSGIHNPHDTNRSLSEERTAGPTGRAHVMHLHSSLHGRLSVHILQPFQQEEYTTIEFDGNLNESNLSLVSIAMQGLYTATGPSAGVMGRDDASFPDISTISPFFGQLEDFMREFQNLRAFGFGEEEDGGWQIGQFPGSQNQKRQSDSESDEPLQQYSRDERVAIKALRSMGCQVFMPNSTDTAQNAPMTDKENVTTGNEDHLTESSDATATVDWGNLAGYEKQKKAIEENLLLPLRQPEVYDAVAKQTRAHFSPNRPRAVLFIGPPGTGKTTSARVIASQSNVPLVYIPLEALASKWYGESEKRLSEALQACDQFPDGCVIFLDELDSLATKRGGDMHEATRRILGVLLRHLDGFDHSKRTVVIGATNRPQDLDAALISRFSATIPFNLPDERCRAAILKQYAQQLSVIELQELASLSQGLSGRDLRDVCDMAERVWASNIIKGHVAPGTPPSMDVYVEMMKQRKTVSSS